MIGRSSSIPQGDTGRTEESSSDAGGFLQFVELDDDVYFANNAKILPSTEAANKNAIVIMLVGDGSSYTEYQYNMVNELIVHIRYVAKNTDIPVYVSDKLVAIPAYDSIGTFDISKLNK